ncbi:MAG: Tol-Pal system protein TolB, partial [Gammaproteobacteria bacterium]|nr:Tol-Pal system protein TolB [Gammaproteobacteria bacterium]
MKTVAVALLNIALVLVAFAARADLTIEITQGADNPTAIAVVPLAWQGAGVAPEDMALVIESDMVRSGQFAPVARTDMLGFPSTQEEVFYRDWRALETEYLLIGKASPAPDNGLRVDYELFDVLRQTRVFSGME